MEAGTHRSAQHWFGLMVDRKLAPGFRALGFAPIGKRYRMEVDRHWADVTVLHAQPDSESSVRFTLLLSVLTRHEWSDQLRVRPYCSARTPEGSVRTEWEAPIGQLVYVSGYQVGQLWWELEAGQPFDGLAKEVLAMVRIFGIPAIRNRIHATG